MSTWGEADKQRGRRRWRQRRRWIRRLTRRSRELYPHPENCTNFATWEGMSQVREWYVRAHYRARKRCSGSCCGNPRNHYGAATAQECKAAAEARDQFEECGIRWTGDRFHRYW